MTCLWFLILMIFNGIIFFPPSEYLYFEVYWCYKEISILYLLLPLANTFGHYLLFILVQKTQENKNKLNQKNLLYFFEKVINFSEKYTNLYFSRYDSSYLAVLYGRCIPIVHTGISVVAGLSNISKVRFLILTLVGNYIFAFICYILIKLIPENETYLVSLLYIVGIFIFLYILHMLLEKYIATLKV